MSHQQQNQQHHLSHSTNDAKDKIWTDYDKHHTKDSVSDIATTLLAG
jgi:hypothetical protein